MKCLYILLLSIISTSYSAPVSQYLIYTPASTQFIKYQPQITSELRLQDGKQVLYYYPTASFSPFSTLTPSPFLAPTSNRYQIIALKDEGQGGQGGFDWQGFFQNWFGGSGESGATGGESAAQPESPAAEGSNFLGQRFDLEKEMTNMTPEKKEQFNKKYYIITNPYYGNFAPFAPVLSFSPLAISERSKETQTLLEKDFKLEVVPAVKVVHTRSIEEMAKEKLAEKEEMKEETKKDLMEKEMKEEMLMQEKKEMMEEPKKAELTEEKKEMPEKETRASFAKEEEMKDEMLEPELPKKQEMPKEEELKPMGK